jgi:bone morphogenetic protein receptor type-1B
MSKIKPKIQTNQKYISNNYRKNSVQASLSNISYTSSGDGPGELIQRTISRDIYIDYAKGPIGRGRYGVVWSAKWNDDSVAVKVFFSMHEQSWSRETEIYQTCMLRHENILGYIASDIKGIGCSINMLLITDYHSFGSLYDYLIENTIEKHQLFKFMYSIINGLNHLHSEIFSTKYKPTIVHRDIKTKNILVKKNMECCLADFGLAVRFDSQTNKMDYGLNTIREGSVRYMAPEILNDTINFDSINELKSTDIYALALTIWEMLIRVDLKLSSDIVEEHRPPYFEYIQGDPPVEKMKEIVCSNKIRPTSHRFEKFNEQDDVSFQFKYKHYNSNLTKF